jgi:hypothetical protein
MEYELLTVDQSIYGLAAGDTEVILNVVEEEDGDNLVDKVRDELNFDGFQGAFGETLPRLQNLQADLSQNLIPMYRYPGNYSGDEWETFEWSPTSLKIRESVEKALLEPQTMNHCVTNYYRDGKDFISHHSDKDLDLSRRGVIVSVSLGDERVFELKRRADPKDITRIILPHGSILVLGPKTNQLFSHSILPKEDSTKPRISLTLREVKTFKDLVTGRMFGQGAGSNSLQSIRTRHFVENSVFFGGFCGLSAWMTSKQRLNTNTCLVVVGLYGTGALSLRFLANHWSRRREERVARDFFSKTSLSGTKY